MTCPEGDADGDGDGVTVAAAVPIASRPCGTANTVPSATVSGPWTPAFSWTDHRSVPVVRSTAKTWPASSPTNAAPPATVTPEWLCSPSAKGAGQAGFRSANPTARSFASELDEPSVNSRMGVPLTVANAGVVDGPSVRASVHSSCPVDRSMPYTAAGPTTTASSAATTGAEAPCCPTGATGKDQDCRYGGGGRSAVPGCEAPPWNCGQANADPGSADCPRARGANRLIGTNATRTANADFDSVRSRSGSRWATFRRTGAHSRRARRDGVQLIQSGWGSEPDGSARRGSRERGTPADPRTRRPAERRNAGAAAPCRDGRSR